MRLRGKALGVLFLVAHAAEAKPREIAIPKFNAYGIYALAVAPDGDVVISGSGDALHDRRPFVIRTNDTVDRIDTPKKAAVFDVAYSEDGLFRWLSYSGQYEESESGQQKKSSSTVECLRDGKTSSHALFYPRVIVAGTDGQAIVGHEHSMDRIDCVSGLQPGKVTTYPGKLFNTTLGASGISGLVATRSEESGFKESDVAYFSALEDKLSLWTQAQPAGNLFADRQVAIRGEFPARFGQGGLGRDRWIDDPRRRLTTRDGSGGVWGTLDRELVHWTPEKGLEHLAPDTVRAIGDARNIRALAWDPVRKALVMAKQKTEERGELTVVESLPSEIIVLEAGRVVTRMDIHFPKVHNTLSPLFLSARSGVIALAVEGALLRFRNGEVTVFYDAEDRASFDHEESSKRNDTLQHLLTIGLGFGSGVAGGAGIAAQPDSARYHRTLGETFSGSLLGSGGNILFLLGGGVLLGGDLRGGTWTTDLGRGIAGAVMIVGAVTGPPLTALGTYGSSELFYRSNPDANYVAALGGAYLGAGIGLVTHSIVCRLTKSDFVRELSLSIATGFVGSMSSWAIHNAGAGAK
ncbi:MAG: hypothetical protein KBF88_07730 [Polyangiaceae bacterium]|nr:hypothetical protein [Polyangiaceae bacterium]